MDTVIVIMEKDLKTGFLTTEIDSFKITENEEYILNIFATKNNENNLNLHINLTTKDDVKDWEYDAIFDHYETNIFSDFTNNILEKTDEYNPTWELSIKYIEKKELLEQTIKEIIRIHKKELEEVFSIIKDKKEEYENELK